MATAPVAFAVANPRCLFQTTPPNPSTEPTLTQTSPRQVRILLGLSKKGEQVLDCVCVVFYFGLYVCEVKGVYVQCKD